MFYQITVIIAPSSGHTVKFSLLLDINTSPYLLRFAVEPLNSLPLRSKRLFSHQMRQLKARQDSWGTTGRQNTTGSWWQAHK